MTDLITENDSYRDNMGRDETMDRPMSTADLAGRTREATATADTPQTLSEDGVPLFPADRAEEMRGSWQEIQASFVDEPRRAVEHADELVARAIKSLAESFADERADLEDQWDRGEDVSTENLRLALQKYRAFFGRLLAV
ncbi:MAG: hypothetical protein R3E04_00930 [Sphingobium sp.]